MDYVKIVLLAVFAAARTGVLRVAVFAARGALASASVLRRGVLRFAAMLTSWSFVCNSRSYG